MRGGVGSILVAAVAVASLAAGGASAGSHGGSTPTTLYFHIFDTFNKFPINTQPMDVDFFDVGGTNFPTVAAQGYDFNTIYGYSTAGPVEYDFIENGRPRFHPERGIARDVLIDASVEPVAKLYLDVRDVFATNQAPMVLPSFTIRVTMRSGDDFGDEAKLNEGGVIMAGSLTAHVADTTTCPAAGNCVSSANAAVQNQTAPDGSRILTPDASGVVEFAVPLKLDGDRISKTDAFNVRIDWWQNPAGALGEDQFSTGYLRLVADQAHLPRLELSVLNPVDIDFLHPQVAAGTLLVHGGLVSPWGTYDVDVGNITFEIAGPSNPKAVQMVAAQHAHVHGLHDQAAEITWLWKFRDEAAVDGDYKISVRVPNLQGTAATTAVAGFKVEGLQAYGVSETGEIVQPVLSLDEAERDTPAAGMLAAALAAAAVALARRGRS